jgi:type IV secretion system protein VirD4
MMDSRFPPRGYGDERRREALPKRIWQHPDQLRSTWDWREGKIVLGQWENRVFGDPDREEAGPGSGDDRHIVTVAGTRAGKSSTVLIPNLLRYPGSVIVIDPKGELARRTAGYRAKNLGQHVVVLDPFCTSGWESGSYNPLDDLDPSHDTFIDDLALIADALIVESRGEAHWTDSAKSLLRGLLLYISASGGPCTLPRLRQVLLGSEGALANLENTSNPEDNVFIRMSAMDHYDGLIAQIGQSFLNKPNRELESILSTAREQLIFLDSRPLGKALRPSDFRLSQLKVTPTTLYLCIPATRLATHARWLRLIISLAFGALERDETIPRHPALIMLEEFNALGYLRPIEYAAGFFAGFGVRLWSVLQDFTQLKTHYPNSWETFLGNAGIIQAFGNVDVTTTAHLSKMMGNTRVTESSAVFVSGAAQVRGDPGRRDQTITTPLLDATEIAHHFARETNRQLILVPGRSPVYMNRLSRPEPIDGQTNP